MKLFTCTFRIAEYEQPEAEKASFLKMPSWSQNDLHPHMPVYSADRQNLGHVAEVYEDSFLVHKGIFFSKNRYIPYSAISTVEDGHVHLLMSADEAGQLEWEKRPDYQDHLSDPTQIMYDRGHGVHDPFDETNPDKA